MATSALTLLLAAPALAEHNVPHAEGTTQFYGQVGKAITFLDDGFGQNMTVLDLDRASTRFGFTGEKQIRAGLVASLLVEGELVSDSTATRFLNSDDAVSSINYDGASDPAGNFTERHARVGLTGDWGSVFMGRTSSATDGVTEKDLGNTTLVMGSDIYSLVGGALFVDGNNRTSHTQSFGATFGNIEGFDQRNDADRVNLVRYDSPIWNGFQASVAVANGGDADLAINYNRQYSGFAVAAGVGFINWNNDAAGLSDAEAFSGSIAVKFNNGLNFALAGGRFDQANAALEDGDFQYVKVGYDTGNWGFGADYGWSNQLGNVATQFNDAESYGLAAQYDFGKGVQVGLSYRNVDTSDGNGAANQRNDVDLLTAAMVVKF